MFNKVKIIAISSVFLGFSIASFAQAINISNPRLHILNTHDTVKLTNQSERKRAFKYKLFSWTQENGYIDSNDQIVLPKSTYTPSEDLQITPRTFVLMPNSERAIRVSLKGNTKPQFTDYRLELEEFLLKETIEQYKQERLLATANASDAGHKVAVLTKITLPVFVPKENKLHSIKNMKVNFSLIKYDHGKKVGLKIVNNDTQTFKINNYIVNGTKLQFSQFILSGVTAIVPLPKEAWSGKFTLDTNHGKLPLDLSE